MTIKLTENSCLFDKSYLIDRMHSQSILTDTEYCYFFQYKSHRFLKQDDLICPYNVVPKDFYKEFEKELERLLDEYE